MLIARNEFNKLPWTKDNIDKYKSSNNLLRHARVNKNTSGIILTTKNKSELVGYIALENDYIIALEVIKKYRNRGIATRLLQYALKNNYTKLSVNKNNVSAIKLYKDLGFKENKRLGNIIFMEWENK